MTDEEIRHVLAEARDSGVMEAAETEMIAGVMRIADRSARGLMVPRKDVALVDIDDDAATVIRRFRETGHSRLPVRDGEADNIVGVLKSRDFLERAPGEPVPSLRDLVVDAPVVRDGLAALDVLEALRRSPAHMVLVYDEYGHFEGIVTPMDVLEAIAGDFSDGPGDEAKLVTRADGSLLVAGWMQVDEFAEATGLPVPRERAFETVAGLVLHELGRLPRVGEHVDLAGWRIEVADLDGRRIDKLIVSRLPKAGDDPAAI